MVQTYDYAIVGGGIGGTTLARQLTREDRGSVVVIDKESSLGQHASGRNSGVIHSGFNYLPGSYKSRFCIEGNQLLREYAAQRQVPHRVCGTFVVARTKAEERSLYMLFGQGTQAGVPGLQMLSREEIATRIPSIRAHAALFSPTGAIIDGKTLVSRLAEDAETNGVTYRLSEKFVRAEPGNILTTNGEIRAKHIVNCAGLYADEVAHAFGVAPHLRIIPFRGEYREIEHPPLANSLDTMVYQAPLKPEYPFLGVHLTPTLDGKLLAGPNSVLSLGRESYTGEFNAKEVLGMLGQKNFWRMVSSRSFLGLALANVQTSFSDRAFCAEINDLLHDSIKPECLRPYRAGIRAQLVDQQGVMVDDIIVEKGPSSTHVLNAVSPGMTSSLAFARHLATLLP